jgi:hypothetical protein
MEGQVLNQMGVAAVGQLLPFWIHRRSHVLLRVVSALPASHVRLTTDSQLAVVPRPRQTPAAASACGSSSPPPPCVLRVQHRPHDSSGWEDTTSVALSAATAAWAGVTSTHTLLELHAERHVAAAAARALVSVRVQVDVADGHVMMCAALRRQLAVGVLHNVVAAVVAAPVMPLPGVVTLRRVRTESSSGVQQRNGAQKLMGVGMKLGMGAAERATAPAHVVLRRWLAAAAEVAAAEVAAAEGAAVWPVRVSMRHGMLLHVPEPCSAQPMRGHGEVMETELVRVEWARAPGRVEAESTVVAVVQQPRQQERTTGDYAEEQQQQEEEEEEGHRGEHKGTHSLSVGSRWLSWIQQL